VGGLSNSLLGLGQVCLGFPEDESGLQMDNCAKLEDVASRLYPNWVGMGVRAVQNGVSLVLTLICIHFLDNARPMSKVKVDW
jgi:hypothetical protein